MLSEELNVITITLYFIICSLSIIIRYFGSYNLVKEIYNDNYLDVTNQWLDNTKSLFRIVLESHYYKDTNGNIFYVDNKNVVLDYNDKEYKIAIWLVNTFGGIIILNPRVNVPKGIKTSDYLWNGESWDLKSLSINAISKNRAVDNLIKRSKYQAHNIILDITDTELTIDEIIDQIIYIFNNPKRLWLKKIIIVKAYKLIKVYERK